MALPPGWSAQKLAEFLAAVSSFATEAPAARGAVERVAESLDAEVAAIVSRGRLVAAVGYPEGAVPVAELDAVARGTRLELTVPGTGLCRASVVPLEHPPGARLVVARSGPDALSTDEVGLLQGMARVASMALRVLRLLDDERALRKESERHSAEKAGLLAALTENQKLLEQLAQEQAALRRVATLVARQPAAEQVLATVTEEAGRLLRAGITQLLVYEGDGTATVAAGWIDRCVCGEQIPIGTRLTLEGDNLAGVVLNEQRSTTSWSPTGVGPIADRLRRCGLRSAAASPITVDGRLWGVMLAGWLSPEPPVDAETRISAFTQLVATAISNAEARRDLERIAREQAARRRVATLVAGGAPPTDVFTAVTDEISELFGAPSVGLYRCGPDQAVTAIATSADGSRYVGRTWSHPQIDHGVLAAVLRTGQPARVDDYAELPGRSAEAAKELGVGSGIGVPVVVDGRVWGIVTIAVPIGHQRFPANMVDRLRGFTELIATSISNTHARTEVIRLAEEQAALRRVATRVAQGMAPSDIFTSVAEEIARISHVDNGLVLRFEADGTATVVASCGSANIRMTVNSNWPLETDSVTARVFRTGRPVRMGGYGHAAGLIAGALPGVEFSSVGAPIVIEDRLWGLVAATSATRVDAQPYDAAAVRMRGLPSDAEERIVNFADLISTAISNADARAQLTASRARVVAAADEARRRLERDLHDGIQQRLVSLVLALRTAEVLAPPELHAQFSQLGDGLIGALDELREISRGIHPAILSEGGLAPALKALSRRSAVPVALDMRTDHRLPERVEVAAYYVVSEALANAAKHAKASVVNVEVDATDEWARLSIRDDGVGGADLRKGSGLIGLGDRVEALGGKITITSPPGNGTSLLVTLPVVGR